MNEQVEMGTDIREVVWYEITDELDQLLKYIGIPAFSNGYAYIKLAVLYSIKYPDSLFSVTKDLYPRIVKYFKNICSLNVERAIRYCIERSWYIGGLKRFFSHYNKNISTRPTNTEFIATLMNAVMDKLNMNYFSNELNVIGVNNMKIVGAEIVEERQEGKVCVEDVLHTSGKFLSKMGISFAKLGYNYIRHAVLLLIKYPEYTYNTTKLYELIAKDFEVTSGSVERCIRTCIEQVWYEGTIDNASEYFDYSFSKSIGRKPKNGEFLGIVSELTRKELNIPLFVL